MRRDTANRITALLFLLVTVACRQDARSAAPATDSSAGPSTDRPTVAGVAFEPTDSNTAIRSIALRVHHLEAMAAFYQEAFGVSFQTVDTFGISSLFGDLSGVTLKLVPIRAEPEFVDFPDLQLGLSVSDIEAVIEIAERRGGRREGTSRVEDGLLHAAVRDPDGNTIELYQSVASGTAPAKPN